MQRGGAVCRRLLQLIIFEVGLTLFPIDMYVCNLTLGQGGGQSNLTISQIASLAALLASSGSTA